MFNVEENLRARIAALRAGLEGLMGASGIYEAENLADAALRRDDEAAAREAERSASVTRAPRYLPNGGAE